MSENTSLGTEGNPHKIEGYAIVGGGIAGLYCSYHLPEIISDKAIYLFESSDRLGGKIESWRLCAEDFKEPSKDPRDDLKETWKNRLDDMLCWDREIRTVINEEKKGGAPSLGKRTAPEILGGNFLKHQKLLDTLLVAEFGPMRVEPDHQPLLKELLTRLGFAPEDNGRPTWSDLVPFSPYIDEPPNEPSFNLEGEEAEQSTMIDLLLLALRRVFENISLSGSTKENPWMLGEIEYEELNYFWNEMRHQNFVHKKYWKRHMRNWINCLRDENYDMIREQFSYKGTPIINMGFWNLIASVLSHMATVKLRDWGSFYHLFNDNPNAAEWLIFWLRAIRSSNSLVGIRGGMDLLVIALCRECGINRFGRPLTPAKKLACEYKMQYRLVRLKEETDGVCLGFQLESEEELVWYKADHVILALPKGPLQSLVIDGASKKSIAWFDALVDSVMSIPLLKCFLLVDNPFWEHDRPANRYAYTIPTREVHYWKTRDKSTGLVMMYTDRPGTEFWSNYLLYPETFGTPENPGEEVGKKSGEAFSSGLPTIGKDDDGKKEAILDRRQDRPALFLWQQAATAREGWDWEKFTNGRLLRTFFTYVKENHSESVPDSQVLAAAIRDWSLKPAQGATHAWRPGSHSKNLIKFLKSFSLDGNTTCQRLHICGEAYSDYQGFIEGALRSAREVLKTLSNKEYSLPDQKKFLNRVSIPPGQQQKE